MSDLFDEQGRFIWRDFDQTRPFSSFLPGIAGIYGIPLWLFYVNRGQGVTSFGVANKNNPIMEFQPANKAYQTTATTGFRTFLNWERGGERGYYEPFSPFEFGVDTTRTMHIGMNELALVEVVPALGLRTDVLYFTLTDEPFAGLVRQVTFTNLGADELGLEVLDGMPAFIPYGVDNGALKHMSRTIEAWMEVFNLEEGIPFYRLRASAEDEAEVSEIRAGNFALGYGDGEGESGSLMPAFVDPTLIFGANTAFTMPDNFKQNGLAGLQNGAQITVGRTPSAFFGATMTLAAGAQSSVNSLYGHVHGIHVVQEAQSRLCCPDYVSQKRADAQQLVDGLTDAIATHTGMPIFDAYCRQTYLDNVLRGGLPLLLGDPDKPHIYHIYSRKHGDPERDYNDFYLAPEPFSQGNGAYRDVNQNRRSDLMFQPKVGAFNIRTFMSLVQADGYNPLVVQGTQFTLSAEAKKRMLAIVPDSQNLAMLLAKPFSPGELWMALSAVGQDSILSEQIENLSNNGYFNAILGEATQSLMAQHGEGFWVDHWTYNLDLIENYLAIFPDKKDVLLFEQADYPFYDNAERVAPREQKYVLTAGGARQFGAVVGDDAKALLIADRAHNAHWARTQHGVGEIFYTTLFVKLVSLAVNKFALLDPYGMGVEMEANKPGWYDALNGLPGVFGSSMPETYELRRLLIFLQDSIAERCHLGGKSQQDAGVPFPREIYDFLKNIVQRTVSSLGRTVSSTNFGYWDGVARAREGYRDKVWMGFDGEMVGMALVDLDEMLGVMLAKVNAGISRAQTYTSAVPLTYFSYTATDYNLLHTQDEQGRPHIRVKGFEPRPLPLFLEGAVRALRVTPDQTTAKTIHEAVKASDLYDKKLKMYKVNASLADEPHAIGRARAFTAGWLENESIWLHMAYKYLLSLLQAELYDDFFEAMQDGLTPFQDPARYGRSLLENSSFLVSSAHPDSSLHGAGFVARLSGSTAEWLHIWSIMMAGKMPFVMEGGDLVLRLRPVLPEWLWDNAGIIQFTFLGHTQITYHNPQKQNSWQTNIAKITLTPNLGEAIILNNDTIPAPYAEQVRDGLFEKTDVIFE